MVVSIVLPCAGEGSRLGLGYPKELFNLTEGIKLIDFSLKHILEATKLKEFIIDVIIIIREGKEMVYEYVSKRLEKISDISLKKVYFNYDYEEWPGSIYSAKPYFSEYIIVLLPDSVISLSEKNPILFNNGKSLIEVLIENLENNKAVFAYLKSYNKNLFNFGALRVENNKIIVFKDKPKKNLDNYNAFWGSFGFRREVSDILYNFLINSVLKDDADITPPFCFAGIEMHGYYDLGTWEKIDYIKRKGEDLVNYFRF